MRIPIIGDFGVARFTGEKTTDLTNNNYITIQYASPEQIECERPTELFDSWAAAVVLYEMLSGNLPFKGDNLI